MDETADGPVIHPDTVAHIQRRFVGTEITDLCASHERLRRMADVQPRPTFAELAGDAPEVPKTEKVATIRTFGSGA